MKQGKPLQWSRMENAAKIFPPTSNKVDTKVFRFVCELNEEIDPVTLQAALDRTLEQFPFYRSILKRGLFWYYFEESDRSPKVRREDRPPCSPIYSGDRKDLLFNVTYYGRRINLEVYHALSDGTGALHFLRALAFYYITKAHGERLPDLVFDYDASAGQQRDDSFSKYYAKEKGNKPPKPPRAYRLRGERLEDYRLGVITGRMSVGQLLERAHQYEATLTEFLTAVLIRSFYEGMSLREQNRPVSISVPVNLRKYFPSETARNFFGVTSVRHCFASDGTSLEDVIARVKACFRENLTQEGLRQRMNRLSAIEHRMSTKIVPLALKNIGLRWANWMFDREVTGTLSNIGRIVMPAELEPYIRLFDVFITTGRLQACTCSFGDNFIVSFTSHLVNTDTQRRFFRTLTGMGVDVEITANLPGE